MIGRLPSYFALDRDSMSAADVVRMALGCDHCLAES